MTNAQNATPAWDMHVDIRTTTDVVASDLTLDEAIDYIDTVGNVGLAVVLPSGSLIAAGTSFHSFVRTLKGAKARLGR